MTEPQIAELEAEQVEVAAMPAEALQREIAARLGWTDIETVPHDESGSELHGLSPGGEIRWYVPDWPENGFAALELREQLCQTAYVTDVIVTWDSHEYINTVMVNHFNNGLIQTKSESLSRALSEAFCVCARLGWLTPERGDQ